MRILPVALVAALALPACTLTPGQKRAGIITGLLTAGAGALVAGTATSSCDSGAPLGEGLGCAFRATEQFGGGLVLAAVGLVILGVSAASEGRESAPVAPVSDRAIAHEPVPAGSELVQLTESARTAARRGSCNAVLTIADRVNDLDPAYRRGAFANDPDIAGCVE
ncbi:MAG: hypothetical protein KF773_33200 [Deltaproteobacteria bacterium]|nr:hypothetical protein [Deltaproteobacteria bacterium]